MQMIAFLTDELSIRRILDHLGISAPPQDKPPPVREIVRVAEHGESSGRSHLPPSPPAPAVPGLGRRLITGITLTRERRDERRPL